MRIFLDLDTRRILKTSSRPATGLEFKRRDNDAFEVQFLRAGAVQELPSGTTARVGLKAVDDFAGEFLATDTLTKSGIGSATVYSGEFNLNTTAIEALFGDEPASITAILEVEWTAGTLVGSSLTLPVLVHNDVIRGNEGTPATLPLFYTSETSDFLATTAEAEAGTDNTKWMSPLRTAQAIEALASGGGGPHTHPLSDLTQSSATTGQVATWNGTAWVPQTPASGGVGVSSWNDLTDKPSTFPPQSHSHDWADIIFFGKFHIDQIPTGTTGTTVALGNHSHVGEYMPVSGGITSISVQATLPSSPDPSVLYILTS